MSDSNTFRSLFQIDVSKHVEKKGQFSYLSWPYAVSQLRLADPAASWEVRRFEGLPYLATDLGYFVEVAVTVNGVTLSQIHPVLDNKNRPILAPTSFDINTSIQRCLVKAIALHGLGLSIYAGEDLPDHTESSPTKLTEPVLKPVSKVLDPFGVVSTSDLITTAQLKFVTRLIDQSGSSEAEVLDFFGYPALEAIPKTEVNRVIKALESKRRAA